jgi:Mg2+ and Co2+ transporter CorA
MSKLTDSLKMVAGYERVAEDRPLLCVKTSGTVEEARTIEGYTATKWTLSTYFGASIYINDLMCMNDPDAVVRQSKQKLMTHIIEDLFGEFRPMIRSIYDATYKRDYEAIWNATRALERAMFEVVVEEL